MSPEPLPSLTSAATDATLQDGSMPALDPWAVALLEKEMAATAESLPEGGPQAVIP